MSAQAKANARMLTAVTFAPHAMSCMLETLMACCHVWQHVFYPHSMLHTCNASPYMTEGQQHSVPGVGLCSTETVHEREMLVQH